MRRSTALRRSALGRATRQYSKLGHESRADHQRPVSSEIDLRNAYDLLVAKVKKPIERIPGVAEVELFGAQRREVDIYLRLDDIKRHRVDVGSLFRRLDSANLNVSLGKVEDSHSRYEAITEA